MILILKQDVKGLGKKGDKIKAADGYARNYLIPNNLAFVADDGALHQLQERETARAQKAKRDLAKAQQLAAELEGMTVMVYSKHGGGGKLYGAVTNQQVAEELKKQKKIEIDRKKIEIREPIRVIGRHEAIVRIHPGITATIFIHVHPLEE